MTYARSYIRNLFWLVIAIGIALAWRADHKRIERLRLDLDACRDRISAARHALDSDANMTRRLIKELESENDRLEDAMTRAWDEALRAMPDQ